VLGRTTFDFIGRSGAREALNHFFLRVDDDARHIDLASVARDDGDRDLRLFGFFGARAEEHARRCVNKPHASFSIRLYAPNMPAKKKKQKKKKKSAKEEPPKALDWARDTGIRTGSRTERATAASKASEHPMHARTQKAVLDLFRGIYPGDESDEEILDIDPNDFDMDPSMFYEMLEERLGVPQDPDNEYFGGYGGPIRDLIAFLTPRWDGKIRK
jgi:hypothetical protein